MPPTTTHTIHQKYQKNIWLPRGQSFLRVDFLDEMTKQQQ